MPLARLTDSSSPTRPIRRTASGPGCPRRTRVAHLRSPLLAVASLTALGLILALSLARPLGAQTRLEGEGRVVAVDAAKGAVTLDHGPIPGLMGAMRMEFAVRNVELLRGLQAGDAIRFSLEPRGPEWIIATLTPAGAPPPRPVTIPAPDFTLRTLAGDVVRLTDLRGKVVLLNFWATWCLPCRTEMPAIEDLYRRYKAQGLEVIGVNLDTLSSAGVEAFLKEVPVTFRIVLDPSWSTTQAYGVVGLPTTYLIDRAGHVVVREVGERNWTDELSQLAVTKLLQ